MSADGSHLRNGALRVCRILFAGMIMVLLMGSVLSKPASAQQTCTSLAASPIGPVFNEFDAPFFDGRLNIISIVTGGQIQLAVDLAAGQTIRFTLESIYPAATDRLVLLSPVSQLIQYLPGGAIPPIDYTAPSAGTYTFGIDIGGSFVSGGLGVGILNIQCVATPPATGALQLIKKTTGGDGTFAFTSTSAALGNPTLTTASGTAQTAATAVNAGTYTLTEAAANGWDLSSIACTGNATAATVNLASRNVSVPVAASEAVACTFTNSNVKDRTEHIIKQFIEHRAELITRNGLSGSRLLDRLGDPPSDPEPCGLKDCPSDQQPMKLGGGAADPLSAARSRSLPGASLLDPRAEGTGAPSGVSIGGAGEDGSYHATFATSLADVAKAAQTRERERMSKLGVNPADYAIAPQPYRQARLDIWAEGVIGRYEAGETGAPSSGSFNMLSVGADYIVVPGVLLVGTMAQFDHMDEENDGLGYKVSGHGWMAGPYAALRLSSHLFLDARGLWGTSDNDISPFLTYTDRFETERWLAAARLTGRWTSGPWRFTPSAEVIKFHETSDAYTDSNGFAIASQSADLGRVIFGPELSYVVTAHDGTKVEPRAAIRGLWDFDAPDTVSLAGVSIAHDDFSARIEAGLGLTAPWGGHLDLSGAYDGLASDTFEAWSGKASLTLPLN